MNASRLSRSLIGAVGLLVVGGFALGAAAAAPIVPGPAGGLTAPVTAGCLTGTALVVGPSIALPGQAVSVQTVLPTTFAACGGPIAFVYTALPPGCQTVSVPALSCVPQASGAFPISETVYAGASSITVHASLVVL